MQRPIETNQIRIIRIFHLVFVGFIHFLPLMEITLEPIGNSPVTVPGLPYNNKPGKTAQQRFCFALVLIQDPVVPGTASQYTRV
ncbi:MAG: hypothetical protein LBB80_11610 [Treponema sp.]|nr:hypothetical protein [Treponema sp.]